MSKKIKALPPIKLNWRNSCMLCILGLVFIVLWIALIFTGANVLAYYIYSVRTNGLFYSETLKYAVMVAVGAYFCLILDKQKIYDALGVRKDLPFITIEQTEKRK